MFAPRPSRSRRLWAAVLTIAFAATIPAAALAYNDNDPGTAPPIPASPFSGKLSDGVYSGPNKRPPDINDYHRFKMVPGQRLRARVSRNVSAGFVLDLYDQSVLSDVGTLPVATTVPNDLTVPELPAPLPVSIDYKVPKGAGGDYFLDLWAVYGPGSYKLSWNVSDQPTFTAPIKRMSGADRYGTAIAISKTFEHADTVLIATGRNYADALSASGLAGRLHAPLLLTDPYRLSPGILDRIKALGAQRVIIIGGTGAVSSGVATTLRGAGLTVSRVWGIDRFETAAKVAQRMTSLGPVRGAFIVGATGWTDALAASPIAYRQQMPILLVKPGSVPLSTAEQFASLVVTDTIVVGNATAVSDEVVTQLGAVRIAGRDRYTTSTAMATYAVQRGWADWSTVGVATGRSFADALAGGIAVGEKGGVILLTRQQTFIGGLGPSPSGALNANKAQVKDIRVFGGTGAVSGLVTTEIDGLFLK